jgi:hypothetical protein
MTLEQELQYLHNAIDNVNKAKIAYAAAEEALEVARLALYAANRTVPHYVVQDNLACMQDLAKQGNLIIQVFNGCDNTFAGVVLKRTPARITVLTGRGEMTFSLTASKYLPAGWGIGCVSKAYHINVEDL